jgi:hypothetical protein
MLAANGSMRLLRSLAPLAIHVMALILSSEALRTCSMLLRNEACMDKSVVIRYAASSPPPARRGF